jgi:hypothetical protein
MCMIKCKDKSYNFDTISIWDDVKIAVVKSTIDYINCNHTADNYDNKRIIIFLCKLISNNNGDITLNNNVVYYDIELLNMYDLGGLYAFCTIDLFGCYSIGNAYDICLLFDIIKEYITRDDNIYESILMIEKVFQESVNKKEKVTFY